MKRTFLLCVAVLTGCTAKQEAGCPPIEKLAHSDPVADARAALARGDRHLLMMGGLVGTVPGVDAPGDYPTQIIEGTSDMRAAACAGQRRTAEAYATKYNRTIAQETGL